jgi:hypothetical protein
MSRGYGIIQQQIIAYLSKPDAYGSINALCQFIYGDQFYLRPTKSSPHLGNLTAAPAKHRLAIVRAAKRLQATGFPIGWMRSHSGQGGPLTGTLIIHGFISEVDVGYTNGCKLLYPTGAPATRERGHFASMFCNWSSGISAAKYSCLPTVECTMLRFQ